MNILPLQWWLSISLCVNCYSLLLSVSWWILSLLHLLLIIIILLIRIQISSWNKCCLRIYISILLSNKISTHLLLLLLWNETLWILAVNLLIILTLWIKWNSSLTKISSHDHLVCLTYCIYLLGY